MFTNTSSSYCFTIMDSVFSMYQCSVSRVRAPFSTAHVVRPEYAENVIGGGGAGVVVVCVRVVVGVGVVVVVVVGVGVVVVVGGGGGTAIVNPF